mgnify:CR=1 FL=1
MKKVFNVFSITLLIFLALITVFPFIYMVLTGLMTYAEATSIPPSFIPSEFKFSNYLEVFSRAPSTLLRKHFIRVSIYSSGNSNYFITSSLCRNKLTVQREKHCHDDFSFTINGSLRINHLYKLPNNRSIRVIKHLCSVNHSVLNKYLLYLLLERILKRNPKHILQSR